MNICPQCGYENRLGVLICEDCGSNIYDASFGQTRVVADETQDSHSGDAQYYAGSPTDNGEVVFQIVGAPSIRTRVEQTLILGRMNRNSPRRPDIDLTGCRAYEKGVSTEHAMLGRESGYLKIADLGSTNGTYINGERLVPHEAYTIRDGDELRLGQLYVRVRFAESAPQF